MERVNPVDEVSLGNPQKYRISPEDTLNPSLVGHRKAPNPKHLSHKLSKTSHPPASRETSEAAPFDLLVFDYELNRMCKKVKFKTQKRIYNP